MKTQMFGQVGRLQIKSWSKASNIVGCTGLQVATQHQWGVTITNLQFLRHILHRIQQHDDVK